MLTDTVSYRKWRNSSGCSTCYCW